MTVVLGKDYESLKKTSQPSEHLTWSSFKFVTFNPVQSTKPNVQLQKYLKEAGVEILEKFQNLRIPPPWTSCHPVLWDLVISSDTPFGPCNGAHPNLVNIVLQAVRVIHETGSSVDVHRLTLCCKQCGLYMKPEVARMYIG